MSRRKARMLVLAIPLLLVALAVALWSLVTQPGVRPRRCAPPEVSATRLEADVRMLAKTLAPRSYADLEHLDEVADHVARSFRASGAELHEQRFTDEAGVERRNVVARYGPDTQALIVLGAHYDAFDVFPGADDNASGVAALLELGRLFGRSPPAMRVELVAWPNEEPPFFTTASMGSYWHARSVQERGRTVRGMLSLEMLGYFTDAPGSQQFPLALLRHFYPDVGNYIVVVGRLWTDGALVRTVKGAMQGASDLPVRSINAPRAVPGVDFSDHLNYWDLGMPAAMVTDTAFYRNPNYHTPNDTPDTLDYARMAKVVQGVYCAVGALSGAGGDGSG